MIDTEKYEGHTPAPWTVYTEEGRDAIYSVDNRAVCDKDGKTIAIIECPYCKEDEHLSYNNKILIADAPLLLAEVKQLRKFTNKLNNIIGTFDDFMCNNWTPENVHSLWNELLTKEDKE